MKQEHIVGSETAAALKAVYTDLADFIHKHKLEQIVGAGPSAYPHTIAIARAYKNRHGKEIKVYSLGELGEKLSHSQVFTTETRDKLALLKRYRPTLDISRNTLLFDETTSHGRTLKNLKLLFNLEGRRCKTATIQSTGVIGVKYADFQAPHEMAAALFGEGVRIHRGLAVPKARREQNVKLGKYSSWPAYMCQLHRELREIADSVPVVEKK